MAEKDVRKPPRQGAITGLRRNAHEALLRAAQADKDKQRGVNIQREVGRTPTQNNPELN